MWDFAGCNLPVILIACLHCSLHDATAQQGTVIFVKGGTSLPSRPQKREVWAYTPAGRGLLFSAPPPVSAVFNPSFFWMVGAKSPPLLPPCERFQRFLQKTDFKFDVGSSSLKISEKNSFTDGTLLKHFCIVLKAENV